MNNRTIFSFLIFSGLFFGQSFAAADPEIGTESIQCTKCSTTFQPPQEPESSNFKCPKCGENFTRHVFISELDKPFTARCWCKVKAYFSRGCCTKKCTAKRAKTILVRCTIIVGAAGLLYLALSKLPDLLPSAMAQFDDFSIDNLLPKDQLTLFNSTCPIMPGDKGLTLEDLQSLSDFRFDQCVAKYGLYQFEKCPESIDADLHLMARLLNKWLILWKLEATSMQTQTCLDPDLIP